jgi:hypothetical protein
MPDSFVFAFFLSLTCFILAFLFFRKGNAPLHNTLVPFLLSLYNPFKIRDQLKKEGIILIILGYAIFIAYVAFFT